MNDILVFLTGAGIFMSLAAILAIGCRLFETFCDRHDTLIRQIFNSHWDRDEL